jgi:hypothetical protein
VDAPGFVINVDAQQLSNAAESLSRGSFATNGATSRMHGITNAASGIAMSLAATIGRMADIAAAAEPRAPTDLQLFLVLGLPNLPARATTDKVELQLPERVLVMNRSFGWSRAIDPADWSEQEMVTVELAATFARTVVEGRPSISVAFIPAMFGGKSLNDWMPGTDLYKGAIERARIAQKDGNLVGILWYQGATQEDPATSADYAKRFAAMIAQLRKDLGVKYVPVIVGELKLGATTAQTLATPLSQVPQEVIPCFFISSEGLRGAGGATHLSSNIVSEYTDRFVRAWMDLAQP